MDAVAWAVSLTGAALAAAALLDAFLTILHPDIEGPIARRVQLLVWRPMLPLAERAPRLRRGIMAAAGPVMLAATLLTWNALYYLGFALVYLPQIASGFHGEGAPSADYSFFAALYYSASTGSVLGFGDITPITSALRMASVLEAVLGFALIGALVTYIFNVLNGVSGRDALALRVHSDTGGSGDGVALVRESLRAEGPDALRARLWSWADSFERLEERLRRFPMLMFYYRSGDPANDPEPLLAVMLNVALAARLTANAEERSAIDLAALRLDRSLTRFMRVVARQYMGQEVAGRIDEPRPDAADDVVLGEIRHRLGGSDGTPPKPADDGVAPELRALASRGALFLDELDRLTGWRRGDGWRESWPRIGPIGRPDA